jgi:hypothetical protein
MDDSNNNKSFWLDAPECTEVKIMQGGPLLITGKHQLYDEEGNRIKTGIMTSVCRCGNSMNSPYCDGTHFKTGFDK